MDFVKQIIAKIVTVPLSTLCFYIFIFIFIQAAFHYYYYHSLVYYADRKNTDKKLSERPKTLKILHLNVWSGSKYTDELSPWTWFSFSSFETKKDLEKRYQNLVRQLKSYNPDIICLNEVMPCPSYAYRIYQDLEDYDCVANCALLGLAFGFLRFPNISEGDAILAKKSLNMKYLGRKLLSGNVFNDTFSCNFDDSTQCIGISIDLPSKSSVSKEKIGIYCTHWRTFPIDTKEEREYHKQNNLMKEANKILKRASKERILEGKKCNMFIQKTSMKESLTSVILTGDLNTISDTNDLDFIQKDGLWSTADEDVAEKPTWDPTNNKCVQVQGGKDVLGRGSNIENEMMNRIQQRKLKLDHVWYRNLGMKNIFPSSSKIVMNENDVLISDHYGILVEFKI